MLNQAELEDILPLSPLQEGFLFLTQLDGDGPDVYIIQTVLDLEGAVDSARLQTAAQALLNRHPNLRAAFRRTAEGRPVALIPRRAQLPWRIVDLSGLDPQAQQAEAGRVLNEEHGHRFDLAHPPLLRMALLRLGEGRHRLSIVNHHILADGWCLSIMVKELSALYASDGDPSVLPPLTPYRKYLAWLGAQDRATAEAAWRKALAGLEAPTLLTGEDWRRGALVPDKLVAELSEELTATLASAARRQGVTVNTLMQAAWGILLGRLTGQNDIVFGTTLSGRPPELDGAESMIGMFVNSLPVRLKLPPEESVEQLLARLQTEQGRLLGHQHLSLIDVQQIADLGQLFDTLVVYQNYPFERRRPGEPGIGLCVRDVEIRSSTHYPLTLILTPGVRLSLSLSYRPDLFSLEYAAALVGRLQLILAQLATEPELPVHRVTVLTADERRRLLRADAPKVAYPADNTLTGLFEAQAQATPEAVALTCGGKSLSYAELNAQANRVAHRLIGHPAFARGQNPLVALCAERSLEMVVGLFGILKAGGAYVPLDPLYPLDRLAYMLDDSAAALLLTQAQVQNRLPASAAAVVLLDGDGLAGLPAENPASQARPADLAYAIYTSGSTGRPKGVAMPHRAAVNHMLWMQQALPLTPDDTVLQKTPISFDASVWELFSPLIAGARLLLAPPDAHREPAELSRLLASKHKVTVLQLVPSLLPTLLQQPEVGEWRSLRRLFCGGEAFSGVLWAQCRERLPNTAVYNLYGPTETCIDATFHACRDGDEVAGVPIGQPIANLRTYVLDAGLQPVPVGVVGELYISGAGLARGYLSRPGLSAERFVADPFASLFGEAGSRMYRAGDLARWRADGELEFIGRADDQVKIRGFRIELGEIEAALLALPGVAQTAVIARQDRADDVRLVAYLVPAAGSLPRPEELRDALRRSLPDYMVPAAFVALDAIPLTANGKLDRKALPVPELGGTDAGRAPQTPQEQLLAEVFAAVLGVESVGADDNFFDLGGHSLLATKLAARIRDSFGVELPVRAVFEHPRLADLAAAVMAVRGGEILPPLLPQSADAPKVLSFAQQRLWFIQQFEGTSATYNMPATLSLDGPLDVVALRASLDWLVNRHDSLRTAFPLREGEPGVALLAADAFAWPLDDLSGLPEAAQAGEVRRRADAHAVAPFDLAHGPLLRVSLLKLCEGRHIMLFNMHHIISDGWSIAVLLADLAEAYQCFAAGRSPERPALAVQYSDYAAWQRGWLHGDALERQRAYWAGQLAGAPILLELPTDRPRPPQQSFRGAHYPRVFGGELAADLRGLARRQGATLFMALLAAFDVLLARYSRQDDILVGSPIAGRTHRDSEGLIGFFVNTLVLRAQVDTKASFTQLLKQVRQTCLDAYDHQDIPFEHLVEQLKPERSLSHSPLFQVMFSVQDGVDSRLDLPGLEVALREQSRAVAKFDLSLSVLEKDGQLHTDWEYATDLFDAAAIARMSGHFEVLLRGIAAHPDAPLHNLPLLDETERRRLLQADAPTVEYPSDRTLAEWFESQAQATPEAVALTFGEERLSYAELNAQANRVAHRLLRHPAFTRGQNPLVALCAERSLEMVVGLLGILKAGGAYVPLDPLYPPDRLAYMLEDSAAALLLTQPCLQNRLPASAAAVVLLDGDGLAGLPAENPAPQARPDDLAYVIYTSGSTGKPKGVGIPHQNVVRLFTATQPWFHFGPADVWTLFHSYAFDFSVWELWGPLLYGGRLVVVPHPVSRSPAQLLELLAQEGVTVLNQTPSAFYQLMQADRDSPGQNLALRKVIFGGEALDLGRLGEWYERHADDAPVLVNMYGITETTVHVTYVALDQARAAANPASLIGLGLPDLRVYVLDDGLQPTPTGVVGELYISGEGLARGYLNRPGLTAERFVADPFASLFGEAGTRMYRAGDLARWREDGELEFFGRADDQVKVRGFRIELGEIEAALLALPGVAQAAVIARQDRADDARLVAYFVPAAGSGPRPEDLRDALRRSLPDYMVPVAFVALDTIPLTANGKLDRKALPVPELGGTDAGRAPQTPQEQLLAEVFAAVLGVESVGADDNFFDLGGHSLLATKLAARIRDSFGVELPVRAVFEHPRLADLAAAVMAVRGGEILPPLLPQSADAPKVLSFAQQRLWFIQQFEGTSATYNMPATLRLDGPLDVDALWASLDWLVNRHDSLRTVFPLHEGEPGVALLAADAFDWPLHDLSGLPEATQSAEVCRRADAHAVAPFDLALGPLLRVGLLRLAEQRHVLLFNMHHIIGDGWSMQVFLDDWAHAYAAFAAHEFPNRPALAVQYSDYAAWQRGWLHGDALERQRAYWAGQLAGAPILLELPTDRPRPPQQSFRGAHYPRVFGGELAADLRGLARRQGATLFMALLAAFDVLLARYSRQDDILVGSPIAGRTLRDSEELIGLFVNTLVLRAQIDAATSFADLLQQTRQTCLDAYAHQDIPFEHLVEQLKPERSLSHSPLFQVMFSVQDGVDSLLDLPGLDVSLQEQAYPVAKFDLSLSVTDQAGQLQATWEYATDLFDEATIARMGGQFETLLRGIIAHPDAPLHSLLLLDEAGRRQLQAWNATEADYPDDKTFVSLFEAQATQNPDAIAVEFSGQALSYAELNAQANRVAHRLLQHPAFADGENPLVALCVERSLEMVTGLLGILKAGGAYVPLDPLYPAARLRYMLDDSGARLLLTQPGLFDRLPPTAAEVLLLDADLSAVSNANPKAQAGPANLAYVIYTSGSTGQPKGVQIAHRSLLNFAYALRERYQISAADRTLQFASVCFDASVEEIFPTLLHGATLVLRTDAAINSPLDFFNFCRETRVSVLGLPTAYWQSLLTDGEVLRRHWPETVRLVLVGGEALPEESVRRWLRHFPDYPVLLNTYGPTEDTVVATACRLTTDNAAWVPIGKPLANTRVYVLDRHRQPQPVGIPGELAIAGVGLARGYLGKPALTAEKFVELELLGLREWVYQTGDLVRWLPDGNLQYLGRIDHQVKLRGFRIELGEIETVLAGHADVEQAVAIVREDRQGDKRLVSYVVASGKWLVARGENTNHSSLTTALREWLSERLPDYMMPAAFVMLDALPLTPNGKLDRKALPVPDQTPTQAGRAPSSPQEQVLCEVFAEVLGLAAVGVDDNFFELGGHSLLATRLVARVRAILGVELELRTLFETPTVAGLAARLERAGTARLALTAGPRPTQVPLSFAQRRLWFLQQMEEMRSSYHMPFALRLSGALDVTALQAALADVVTRHESLRTVFPQIEGTPYQRVLSPEAAYPKLAVTPANEADLPKLLTEAAERGFDLAAEPPLRAELFALGGDEQVLLLLIHHIAGDGWSVGPLAHDLGLAYAARLQGAAPAWTPLPVQYADYTLWQNQLLGEQTDPDSLFARQLAYWTDALAGLPEQLQLPVDRPRPAVASYRGGHVPFALDPELHQGLVRLAREAGASLFMVLQASLAALLSRLGAGTDIPLGSPIAGRTDHALDTLVGFFVNTLVLRTDTAGDPSFRELILRTREADLAAYAHQDLPFEYLVEALNPARSLSHHPLFQVMLVWQNNADSTFALPGLDVSNLPVATGTAKFDLLFALAEQRGADGSAAGIQGAVEYASDLFDVATVAALAERWQSLLTAALAQPDQPISRIDLLTAGERHMLLVDYNGGVQGWPCADQPAIAKQASHSSSLPALFEAQVAIAPDAVAVVFDEAELSYAELNAKANRLAHALIAHGVGPERVVALLLPRTPDLIVALLAVLKAGAAYLPVDPDYPAARISAMLGDAHPAVVLASRQTVALIPEAVDAPRLVVDEPTALVWLDGYAATNPSDGQRTAPLQAEHPAYVIYTSGSTGMPKGVVMPAGALVNLLLWHNRVLPSGPGTRIAQFTALSFDVSAQEILSTLAFGKTLVVPADEVRRSADQLAVWLDRHRVAELFAPNLVVEALAEAALEQGLALPFLKDIAQAGEALTLTRPVREFYHLMPGRRLHNHYGPTETHVATGCTLPTDLDTCPLPPSIGRPIDNLRVYVLDDALGLTPSGVAGELYIAGAGLARGYLNRPGLSAERFVADPFGSVFGESGARMYRTGDNVRWRNDGALEFLGRVDDQVKIRGFRIELGDIEAALTQNPELAQAVVVAHA